MQNTAYLTASISAFFIMSLGVLGLATQANAVGEMPSKAVCAKKNNPRIIAGGCIATDRQKGNCMSCHNFKGLARTDLQAGNIAEPLIAMKARYPDKKRLRAQLWDPSTFNPGSNMPPFGKHGVLTEKEINLVVEWLHSL
ncbi:MAG: sulfur oxidation c-type cytochrome SoxX [Acidiferrobacterales bacterium]